MSRYLEFTTSSRNPFTTPSLGAPVHDGNMPTRFRELLGVRVDGELVAFTDAAMPDRLHQALTDSKQLQKRGIPFHCFTFAALMLHIPLQDADDNPFMNTYIDVDCATAESDAPAIVLGVHTSTALFDFVRNRHIVVPAPQVGEQSYVHKLGEAGPVCLSGLRLAMDMYDCNVAHPAIIAYA